MNGVGEGVVETKEEMIGIYSLFVVVVVVVVVAVVVAVVDNIQRNFCGQIADVDKKGSSKALA
jgi:hypothetical protein